MDTCHSFCTLPPFPFWGLSHIMRQSPLPTVGAKSARYFLSPISLHHRGGPKTQSLPQWLMFQSATLLDEAGGRGQSVGPAPKSGPGGAGEVSGLNWLCVIIPSGIFGNVTSKSSCRALLEMLWVTSRTKSFSA